MQKINGPGHLNNTFVAEDPTINRPPTEITAEWLNAVQAELIAACTADGAAVDSTKVDQLAKVILSRIRIFAAGAALPVQDVGPIWHSDYKSVMTWNGVTYVAVTLTEANNPAHDDDSTRPVSSGWLRRALSNIAIGAGFLFNTGSAGYIRFPTWLGGLLIQWGEAVNGSGGFQSQTFPLAFPNACLQIAAFPWNNTNGLSSYMVWVGDNGVANSAVTKSGFKWSSNGVGNPGLKYISVGF